MKHILFFLLVAVIFSCQTNNNKAASQSPFISDFLTDINSIKSIEGENPIEKFQALAQNEASEVIVLTAENIEEVLNTAKNYKHCVITTGIHTIIKITDLANCKESGSWKTCMPFAQGFIKKGELIYKEDYMNNIIGIPDSQERKVYLFK